VFIGEAEARIVGAMAGSVSKFIGRGAAKKAIGNDVVSGVEIAAVQI